MISHPPFFFHQAGAGYLQIAGPDRVDFLQRQSTNDVRKAGPGRHISTVLTSPSARIIDVLQLFHDSDEATGAVTLAGRGAATAQFLRKRIFFNDKVSLADLSAQKLIVDLGGAGFAGLLSRLGLSAPEEGQVVSGIVNGLPLRVAGQHVPSGPGCRLICESAGQPTLFEALQAAGAQALSAEEYDALRVAAGLPGPEGELTEDYTPLETGLGTLVSDSKGCYTGQEVIARQISYDKITRSLAGLRLESPAETGARVMAGGQPVGTLTSYARLESLGHLALAVIKRPNFEPGTRLEVEKNGGIQQAVVVRLPFES